ncbi:Ribosomal protein S25 family protein [Perilla frutescens var. hirtella]|nr:Ribosomal protein S25 family protein [Perilla frutescens var. hirtella]
MMIYKATYDKLLTQAPKYKLITPFVLSDRLNQSIIGEEIKNLMARGLIRMVSAHSSHLGCKLSRDME